MRPRRSSLSSRLVIAPVETSRSSQSQPCDRTLSCKAMSTFHSSLVSPASPRLARDASWKWRWILSSRVTIPSTSGSICGQLATAQWTCSVTGSSAVDQASESRVAERKGFGLVMLVL